MKLVRRKKGLEVAALGQIALDKGVMKGGVIQEEEKIVAALKAVLASVSGEKIRTRYVVVSLPDNKAFLQVIPMPKLKGQELRAAVTFEAENYIPLPLEKVYLDFEVVPPVLERADRCEVLIAALPREIVDSRISAMSKAGLVPIALELESQAVARILSQENEIKSPTIIIQIGDDKTNLVVYSENSIRFSFSIPISNRYFIETIMENANSDADGAEHLKTECGIEEFVRAAVADDVDKDKEDEKRKIFDALIPGLVDFVQQVQKCIQYYQTHDEGGTGSWKKNADKVLICGSGSNLKGLDEFLALKLNAPVQRVHPPIDIKKIESKAGGLATQNACGYATVAGLAMRALGEAGVAVSKSKPAIVAPAAKKDPRGRVRVRSK
jgi:type IV pilus assembly protein PilM